MTEFHRTSQWATFRKMARPILKASLPRPCVNLGAHPSCTGVVMPGQPFDVAHLPGRDHHLRPWAPLTLADVGPAHPKCNRTAGSRAGRAIQVAQQRRSRGQRDERTPQPGDGSGWN